VIKGIGVDSVSIPRFIKKNFSSHIIQRMFHPSEVKQIHTLEGESRFSFMASRFAAKEAFVKALGEGFRAIAPSHIAVVVDELGKPTLQLDEKDRMRLHLENVRIHLSLTHEDPTAIAFVVLEETCGTH
jgi:holo-[acyl-carrier protein] synthase